MGIYTGARSELRFIDLIYFLYHLVASFFLYSRCVAGYNVLLRAVIISFMKFLIVIILSEI